MADENRSYTNIDGKTVSPSSIVTEMIASLRNKLDNGDTRLTDVNEGSELRNLLETMAYSMYDYLYENEQLCKQSLVRYAEGDWLDDIGYMVGLTRKGSTRACGDVVFSIETPIDFDYDIMDGTRILSNKTGLGYTLNAPLGAVTIKAGETQTTGYVCADEGGSSYNCSIGELTVFDSDIILRHDLSVTNNMAFTSGEGYEDDASFRSRILTKMKGDTFGSRAYYESLVLAIDGIRAVSIVPPSVLNTNDDIRHTISTTVGSGACNSCHGVVVVDYDNTYASDVATKNTVKQAVIEAVTDQDNIVLGHKFHVQDAVYEKCYLKINWYPTEVETDVTQSSFYECLDMLFNYGTYSGKTVKAYDGFDIGEAVSKYELLDALENIEGVSQVESIKQLYPYSSLSYVRNNTLQNFLTLHKQTYDETQGVLNFPDEDDDGIDADTCTVPCWHGITSYNLKINDKIYELCVDGYYFYKMKDNTGTEILVDDSGDTLDDEFKNWGIKQFTSITIPEDSVAKIGRICDVDPITGDEPETKTSTYFWLTNLDEK